MLSGLGSQLSRLPGNHLRTFSHGSSLTTMEIPSALENHYLSRVSSIPREQGMRYIITYHGEEQMESRCLGGLVKASSLLHLRMEK